MQAYNVQKVIVTQPHSSLDKRTMMGFAIEKDAPAIASYITGNAAFWVFSNRELADKFLLNVNGVLDT